MTNEHSQKIEIYRELSIEGAAEKIDHLMTKVSSSLKNGWVKEVSDDETYGTKFYVFKCTETTERQTAKLWFARSTPNRLYISNIVPEKIQTLTRRQYNEILIDFFHAFIEPIAATSELKIQLDEDWVGLDHWLDKEAIKRLNAFSNLANKSTGTGHPLDERRWFLFLFYVHEKGGFEEFYPDALARWLNEILGWGEDSAHRLAASYERSLRLLREYDKYRISGDLPY